MRKKFMGGNWKMNGNQHELVRLVREMRELGMDEYKNMDIVVFPSFVYLDEIKKTLKGSVMRLGAQNQADQLQGAFTGEVSWSSLILLYGSRALKFIHVILAPPCRNTVEPSHAKRIPF